MPSEIHEAGACTPMSSIGRAEPCLLGYIHKAPAIVIAKECQAPIPREKDAQGAISLEVPYCTAFPIATEVVKRGGMGNVFKGSIAAITIQDGVRFAYEEHILKAIVIVIEEGATYTESFQVAHGFGLRRPLVPDSSRCRFFSKTNAVRIRQTRFGMCAFGAASAQELHDDDGC
jgi:hypothetical protein